MAYFEKTYGPDWKGIDASKSAVDIDDNCLTQGSSPFSSNFIVRGGGLINGLQIKNLNPFFGFPEVNKIPLLLVTVTPLSAGFPILTASCVVYVGTGGVVYVSDGVNSWGSAGAFPYTTNLSLPLNSLTIQGSLYIPAFNGIAKVNPISGLGGPGTVSSLTAFTGGVYIGELGGHLLVASTSEAGVTFPYRLRWSGVYNFPQWNSAVDATAGFQDLSDVKDVITGLFTFGTVGYILRTHGISQINVASSGTAPFQFDHLWKSELGIGCFYPYSAAQYGPLGVFVGQEDVYILSSSGYESIGGISKNSIFYDLQNAPVVGAAQVLGSIVPYLSSNEGTSVILGSDLIYILAIPQTSGSIIWIYNFTNKTWSRNKTVTTQLTSYCNLFVSPVSPFQGPSLPGANSVGGNYSRGLVVAGAGINKYCYFIEGGAKDFTDPNPVILYFKFLSGKPGRKITIHKVIIEGQVPSQISPKTITLAYYNESGQIGSSFTATATIASQGIFSAQGTKTVSGQYLQLYLTMTDSDVMQINKITICGNDGDGDQL